MVNPLGLLKNRLRMRHLQLLYVLSDKGSLRQAAEAMAMTQPAATKALRELEDLVGEPLFTRTPRGLVPNMLGEAALRYAQLVYADLGGLHEEMMALKSGNLGKIRIGAMGSLTGGLLPGAIAKLKQSHPKLNITAVIDTSDVLLQALGHDQLDLLVARIPQGWSHDGLNFEPFGEEVIQIVARTGHPQMRNDQATLATLAEYPWVVQSQPTPLREIYNQIFREAQVQAPLNLVETASTMLTVSLLQQTDMIALMPLTLVDYYHGLGVLSRLPVPLSGRLTPFGLISRKSRLPTPSMRLVGDALRAQARLLWPARS